MFARAFIISLAKKLKWFVMTKASKTGSPAGSRRRPAYVIKSSQVWIVLLAIPGVILVAVARTLSAAEQTSRAAPALGISQPQAEAAGLKLKAVAVAREKKGLGNAPSPLEVKCGRYWRRRK
jgi:hypothetical protein